MPSQEEGTIIPTSISTVDKLWHKDDRPQIVARGSRLSGKGGYWVDQVMADMSSAFTCVLDAHASFPARALRGKRASTWYIPTPITLVSTMTTGGLRTPHLEYLL